MTFSSPLNKRGVTPAKAMVAAISGYAMDGFDLLILGFMLPAISVSLALSTSQAGSLVTWTLIGAVLGGIFFRSSQRPPGPYSRPDLHDPDVLGLYRPLCGCAGLLGSVGLSYSCRYGARRRIRYWHGADC
ncbi:putative sialic acid transporter [Raoultella planticola]|uniref:Putative sialic acid transporter n=1 Tax=Raoultella planticola TaxID=575 RepID=A0A485CV52_RAOPL|nr:putative sialic acid transporter [Raoultella planticola]